MANSQNNLTDWANLNGRAAVVTGASRGIGRATALELAAAGADVFLHTGFSHDRIAAVSREITDLGQQASPIVLDLSKIGNHDQLITAAMEWSDSLNQPIDIWINNAGVDVLTTGTDGLKDASFETKLQSLWEVDVLASIRLSRAIGQQMHRRLQAAPTENNAVPPRTGSLINIGWDQAAVGMAGDSGEMFATIKGAVMAFTRSLAKTLAPHVRVNCVAPGWILTDWGDEASTYWQSRATGESLLNRWGTPADVARTIRFLVSDAGSFINGQIIPVNGGSQPWPNSHT